MRSVLLEVVARALMHPFSAARARLDAAKKEEKPGGGGKDGAFGGVGWSFFLPQFWTISEV